MNVLPFFSQKVYVFHRGKNPQIRNKVYLLLLILLNPIFFYIKIKKTNPTYVIVNTSLNLNLIIRDGILVLLSILLRKKTLLIVHGFRENALKYKLLLKIGYFKADAIIVLASEFKKKITNIGYTKKIYTQFNPVSCDILDFQNDVSHKIFSRRIKQVLFLSRIEKEKGIYIAIEVFKLLLKQNKELVFHIAGSGSEYNNVKEQLKKGNSDKIILHEFVEGKEKNHLLQQSDILLFPTSNEGLPINVLEAMIVGMFIVTRPVGGLIDLYQKNPFGICLGSTDPQDFAEAIIEIINDKKRIIKIRQQNMVFAKENFHPSAITNNIERILLDL
jgi:glycosyltransferase involved in cell wall biosynthesis